MGVSGVLGLSQAMTVLVIVFCLPDFGRNSCGEKFNLLIPLVLVEELSSNRWWSCERNSPTFWIPRLHLNLELHASLSPSACCVIAQSWVHCYPWRDLVWYHLFWSGLVWGDSGCRASFTIPFLNWSILDQLLAVSILVVYKVSGLRCLGYQGFVQRGKHVRSERFCQSWSSVWYYFALGLVLITW